MHHFLTLPVFAKKTIARKFGAKASFEVGSTRFYVIFREESEFEVKNCPTLSKIFQFSKLYNFVLFFGNFPNPKVFNKNKKVCFLSHYYLDKLVEYEWIFEYPLDGFDVDGSDVEAGDLGLDGLHPALQESRDPWVRVIPLQKLLSLVVGHAVLSVRRFHALSMLQEPPEITTHRTLILRFLPAAQRLSLIVVFRLLRRLAIFSCFRGLLLFSHCIFI